MESNKPAHEIRVGLVKATIWKVTTAKDSFFTATFSRLYKAGGQTKESHSFGPRDLSALGDVFEMAKAWIAQQGAQ